MRILSGSQWHTSLGGCSQTASISKTGPGESVAPMRRPNCKQAAPTVAQQNRASRLVRQALLLILSHKPFSRCVSAQADKRATLICSAAGASLHRTQVVPIPFALCLFVQVVTDSIHTGPDCLSVFFVFCFVFCFTCESVLTSCSLLNGLEAGLRRALEHMIDIAPQSSCKT